ncbi:HAUS7-like protein [Mya arenaria]|uniref:HAUS7-like protein n=1 Tax=Mya arenaria TaxID=6604 RepID=A0ABY7FWN8_MYAAR|nr:HAUS7-like protein [Mya arenaria]
MAAASNVKAKNFKKKFDSALNEVLDPQYASVESKMDSRIQRLLYVASNIGLCRYDDVDLIRGVVPASRQSSFMEHLIDIVAIADASEDPKNKLFREPGLVSDAMPLEEQLAHDTAYMNNLCVSGPLDAVFSPRLALLPLDLQKQLEARWAQAGKAGDIKVSKPDLQAIENAASDYQSLDAGKVETVCRTVSLVLSELFQLITGFTYCYENEMRQWCNKSPPKLTQLGAAFKRVHRLLQQFLQMLQNLGDIRRSYTALNREPSERLAKLSDTHSLVSAGAEALEGLQGVVDVLEESIQHVETASAQTTPRSTHLNASTLKGIFHH